MTTIIRFLRNEEAATAVEYAVMIALIVGVAVTSITSLGTKTNTVFSDFEATMP